jgi:hypothetical protein
LLSIAIKQAAAMVDETVKAILRRSGYQPRHLERLEEVEVVINFGLVERRTVTSDLHFAISLIREAKAMGAVTSFMVLRTKAFEQWQWPDMHLHEYKRCMFVYPSIRHGIISTNP